MTEMMTNSFLWCANMDINTVQLSVLSSEQYLLSCFQGYFGYDLWSFITSAFSVKRGLA